MSRETILVTGGAGFIGSHVCERLLDMGYSVINLDNFNSYYDPQVKEENIQSVLSHPDYFLYRGDIRDYSLLQNIFAEHTIHRIVHLAAMAGVRNSLQDPGEYVDVDIKGTVHLLEMARQYSIRRFVFASSSSVYGVNRKVPFEESDQVEMQVSPYATAKRAGELYCMTYHQLYQLSVGMLRFFTVYGPRQRPEMAIHLFTRLINEGKPIPVFGDGSSSRDYTYIDDIVDGVIAAMEKDYNCEIFNLGNSETISLRELIQLIENEVGKKAIWEPLSNQLGDVPRTYADIEKSKKQLGYKPQINITEGVKRFVAWYKETR